MYIAFDFCFIVVNSNSLGVSILETLKTSVTDQVSMLYLLVALRSLPRST